MCLMNPTLNRMKELILFIYRTTVYLMVYTTV